MEWVVQQGTPEWIQLFIYAKMDTAAADNTIGIIATVLAANPKVKKFLESYRHLVHSK